LAKSILISGATGFIGGNIVRYFQSKDFKIYAPRYEGISEEKHAKIGVEILDLDTTLFPKIDMVIHTAARVHCMKDNQISEDLYDLYTKTNVEYTRRVASFALKSNIPKFVFLSSVKVYGNKEGCFSEISSCKPDDFYGSSKRDAENLLLDLYKAKEASLVILRLPMVYGEGNKGNILSLLYTASRGIPLPLGAAKKKRSFVYVGNIVDLCFRIYCFKIHGIRGIFNVTDGTDITSKELYSYICENFSTRFSTLYVPEVCFNVLSMLLPSTKSLFGRLFSEYCFEIKKVEQFFNWKPPISTKQGITNTSDWFKEVNK